MKKAIDRLDIYIAGDRLHVPGKTEKLCRMRLDREPQSSVEIPDYRRKERGGTRKPYKSVETGPNAPLLKRMIRNPQALERAYFKRKKVERMSLDSRQKIVFPRIVKEELQRDRKIRKIQAMKLHFRAVTVNIPSIDDWLRGRDD